MKRIIALQVWTVREYGYFHVYAKPIAVDVEQSSSDCELGNFCSMAWDNGAENLLITSQGGTSAYEQRDLYAWGVVLDAHHADRGKVERAAKMMAKIDKHLLRAAELDGAAETFGRYVARVAKAMGATHLLFKRSDEAVSRCGYHWRADSLGDGIASVNRLVSDWATELQEAAS